MKIIITAIISIDSEQRPLLLNALKSKILDTRQQTGCVRYDWAADGCDPEQINVFEEWADESALDGHFAGENFAATVSVIGEYSIKGMAARKYGISKEAPVFNAEGKPSSQF